jgi:L-alanine-DL-glutamate epimerase-like enolase superfamily enzyme
MLILVSESPKYSTLNMKTNRRSFLKQSTAGAAGSMFLLQSCKSAADPEPTISMPKLDAILSTPVLKTELFPDPVIIASVELLRYDSNFICRVRSEGGAEGISVSNNSQMQSLYPIFLNRLQPFFPGKDARMLEQLLDEVYVYKSNYKLQGLPLWVPLATLEFAILDMLGRIAGMSMCNLLGTPHHKEIGVYRANNHRGKSAAESLERIIETVEESGAKALKYKIGGRMSRNMESPPGRTEELIPMIRKHFGSDMAIYADSNGSYDVPEAIRIGRILEENQVDFYEEPVPFDWYEETRQVTEALDIPVAGGEQEPSLHNFRWLIANGGLDIVQPDIFYFGGMIRSLKVARMAEVTGKSCIPHISGSGLGYLYMLHFVSILPNAGPYHEFKGFNSDIPLACSTSDLAVHDGKVTVPSGPGSGVELDPDFVAKHLPVML